VACLPGRLKGMPATHAALGFKLHTGWAAVVVAARTRGQVEVLLRRRIELLPEDGSVPRFVYHEAAEVGLAEARKLVKRAARAAQEAANAPLLGIIEELRARGVSINAAGVATGSTTLPSDLTAILAAHTLIHSAEGVLFQDAVAEACAARGLQVIRVPERELWTRLGGAVRAEVDGLRGIIGPPWGADQKTATGVALAALGVGFSG
jgi:hypothetical protein